MMKWVKPGDTLRYDCPWCSFSVAFRVRQMFLAPMFLSTEEYEPMRRHVRRHVPPLFETGV